MADSPYKPIDVVEFSPNPSPSKMELELRTTFLTKARRRGKRTMPSKHFLIKWNLHNLRILFTSERCQVKRLPRISSPFHPSVKFVKTT
jgi:hypothetical protein